MLTSCQATHNRLELQCQGIWHHLLAFGGTTLIYTPTYRIFWRGQARLQPSFGNFPSSPLWLHWDQWSSAVFPFFHAGDWNYTQWHPNFGCCFYLFGTRSHWVAQDSLNLFIILLQLLGQLVLQACSKRPGCLCCQGARTHIYTFFTRHKSLLEKQEENSSICREPFKVNLLIQTLQCGKSNWELIYITTLKYYFYREKQNNTKSPTPSLFSLILPKMRKFQWLAHFALLFLNLILILSLIT